MKLQASGFLVQYGPMPCQTPAFHVRYSESEHTALGPGCRIVVRPDPATREAARDRQLLLTSDGVVAYSGRVDNRRDVAERLGEPRLASATDGEVLLRAYRAWGAQFAAHVIGEYAFAIVDPRTDTVTAGRDSLGIAHLFRHHDGTFLWLASSLDLLLEGLDQRPAFDRDGLAEYVAGGGLLTSGRTVYAGIREIAPAHVLIAGAGSEVVREYWRPNLEHRARSSRAEEYDERLRALLTDGVRAALRSRSAIWSDLSGGLDSSTVTAFAARLVQAGTVSPAKLAAFSTMASQTAATDESRYQADFLAMYPLEHHTIDADAYPSFSSLPTISPSHPSKAVVYGPLRRATAALFKAHGVSTHLTGKGGDNVFCSGAFAPYYLGDLLRGLHYRRWWQEARRWSRVGNRSLLNLFWRCSVAAPTDLFAGAAGTAIVVPSWLTPPFREMVRAATIEPWRGGRRVFDSWAREIQYRSIALGRCDADVHTDRRRAVSLALSAVSGIHAVAAVGSADRSRPEPHRPAQSARDDPSRHDPHARDQGDRHRHRDAKPASELEQAGGRRRRTPPVGARTGRRGRVSFRLRTFPTRTTRTAVAVPRRRDLARDVARAARPANRRPVLLPAAGGQKTGK